MIRVSFSAATTGEWQVETVRAIRGESLVATPALSRVEGADFAAAGSPSWVLHGTRSNERYLERSERERLTPLQQGLGRPDSQRGALIPLSKADAWWDLPQDERRRIFEAQSHHIDIGAAFLPAIARRLYHCRDLGGPFDFLTWFEFAPADQGAFDDLLGRLRQTEEWKYVTREVEVRVRKD